MYLKRMTIGRKGWSLTMQAAKRVKSGEGVG